MPNYETFENLIRLLLVPLAARRTQGPLSTAPWKDCSSTAFASDCYVCIVGNSVTEGAPLHESESIFQILSLQLRLSRFPCVGLLLIVCYLEAGLHRSSCCGPFLKHEDLRAVVVTRCGTSDLDTARHLVRCGAAELLTLIVTYLSLLFCISRLFYCRHLLVS